MEAGAGQGEGRCVVAVVDKMLAYTVIPYVIFFVSYWALSAFFTLCDRLLLHLSQQQQGTPRPVQAKENNHHHQEPTPAGRWLDRFKIQEGLDEERLRFGWRHLLHVLALQIFVSIPIGLALSPFWPDFECDILLCASTSRWFSAATQLPHHHELTLSRFAFEFIAILILFEIFFYYSHLTLHRPFFYKRIHKLHHFYTAPVGPAAQYVHWIEHAVANSLAPILPGIIVGAHPLTYCLWIFLATCTVVASHSGYGRYALITSEEHDLHHKHFNVNFGTLGFLDYLHGTAYSHSAHFVRDQEKRNKKKRS